MSPSLAKTFTSKVVGRSIVVWKPLEGLLEEVEAVGEITS